MLQESSQFSYEVITAIIRGKAAAIYDNISQSRNGWCQQPADVKLPDALSSLLDRFYGFGRHFGLP